MTDQVEAEPTYEGLEQGVVARGTVVYDDPVTGEAVHAGPGEPVWIAADEMAGLRARGAVIDPDAPATPVHLVGSGPPLRWEG